MHFAGHLSSFRAVSAVPRGTAVETTFQRTNVQAARNKAGRHVSAQVSQARHILAKLG